MTLQKIEFMYEIPEGYRFVGYRKANEGEHYLRYGKVLIAQSENGSEWPIVEKIPEQQQYKEKLKLQFKNNNGKWIDFISDYEYRIKPKTKTIRFRNFLHSIGNVLASNEDISDRDYFVKWLGDWQEVEIEEND